MRTASIACLALCASTAWTVEYYVSGSGSDDNTGRASNAAYRNLAKAASVVVAGDTVWIMNGTYAPFTLSRSGTSAAPITWKAYAGHKPELASTSWNAISVNASWQIIDGLTLTGANDSITLAAAEADYAKDAPNGLYNGNGILLDNRNKETKHHHLTVRNCTVRKFPGGGIATIQADYTVVENCDIYENAWYSRYGCSGLTIFPHNADSGAGYRNIIRGNRLWYNCGLVKWKQVLDYSDGNGFILDVTADDYSGRTLVTNNLAVNNGGSGIHAYKGRHADIVNNTAYMNGWKVGYADIFAGYSTDIVLKNNIAYSRVGGKANTNSSNTSVVYDHNIYFNGTRAVTGAHDIVADPKFVAAGLDPLSSDFRILGASPARDAGVAIAGTTPTVDILGTSRPRGSAIDRGAYEFIPPPAITSSLTRSGEVGTALSYQIAADNLPTSFAASGLPTGLAIATTTGLISGTPRAVGTSNVTISATNDAGTGSATLVLTIAPDSTPPAAPGAPHASSTASATPTLTGATEADATVRIYDGATLIGTVTANASGAWTWTVSPDLAVGSHVLTVRAIDTAGNASPASPATTVTVASTAGASQAGASAGEGSGCGLGGSIGLALGILAYAVGLRRAR